MPGIPALLEACHLPKSGTIIDVCSGPTGLAHCYADLLNKKLLWKPGPYRPIGLQQRLLPSPLLSDDKGSQLFKAITRLPGYYQLSDEIELLQHRGIELARRVMPHTILVDLGCGDVHKAMPLLDHLESLGKQVCYFALDLAKHTLEEGLALLKPRYRFVTCCGLWGTFDDGIAWLNAQHLDNPRLFLSLGSIFGNDHYNDAVDHLKLLKTQGFRSDADSMLLSMDATNDAAVVWNSYHDAGGLFERFVRNGFLNSNRVLGCDWYRDEDWEFGGRIQEEPFMHRFVLRAKRDVVSTRLQIRMVAGTEIDCYEGFKYSPDVMRRQFAEAGFDVIDCLKAPRAQIYQYLLAPSKGRVSDGPLSLPTL